jgi:tubulin-specific chaperone A
MPAPSQLAIATSVLNRLIKEEKSYHKELEQQNVKIAKLEAGEDADNENAEFILRQQVSNSAGSSSSLSICNNVSPDTNN